MGKFLVNAKDAKIGDYIIAGQEISRVINITVYPPGTHDESPISNDMTAVRLNTESGNSRWYGKE